MLNRRRFLSQSGRLLAQSAGAALLNDALSAGASLLADPPAELLQAAPLQPARSAGFTSGGVGSLRAHAAARGLRYGSAVDVGLLRTDTLYRQLLVEQCSIVVGENAMKWAAVHPAPDHYSFDQADELVAFAEQHGIEVRGHNLCWHEGLPAWFAGSVTQQNAAFSLTDHIRTVAGRYKGRLRAWDVVNEAIDPKDGRPDGLRDSPWLRLLGPNYVELAFHTAREADPHALLTYNDYGIEYDHPDSVHKRLAVLALLRRFKAKGVPIDAVGVQSHLDASTSQLGPGITAFVAEVGKLGLKVFLTELDVNDDNVAADDTVARDAAVAQVYREYVSAMIANGVVTDVLTWGVSDDHCWLNSSRTHEEKHPRRQERALPFDAAYRAKPAFYALRDAIDARKS